MKQTVVEWLYERLERMIPRTISYDIDKKQYLQQAKEMEKEQRGYTEEQVYQFWKAGQKYWETSGNSITFEELIETLIHQREMTREEKLETIVKLFAKSMFYGKWQWETPNERVITMLMQEVGMYPFKDEDEMISKTPVSDDLYQKVIKEITFNNNHSITLPNLVIDFGNAKLTFDKPEITINELLDVYMKLEGFINKTSSKNIYL